MAQRGEEQQTRPGTYAVVFGFIAAIVLVTHLALLDVPFYWDELGQFVPASLDLFQLGDWVPVTTVPNIHPPGLMAYLAAVWHVTGYSIPITRIAMLALASAGACCAFLLTLAMQQETAEGRAFAPAFAPAFTAVLFLCLSPLFAAQSMMVQLDMPAMVFTVLALLLFLQNRMRWAALACVVLVMMKETGIVAPAVFGFWLLLERRWKEALLFTAPLAPLFLWLVVLHRATGNWAGNESFAAYNAVYSLHPVRFALALFRRIYYLFLGTGHWIGVAAVIYAWKHTGLFRSRGWRITVVFVGAHVLVVSLFGGAVLERYLMPVLPLLYMAFALAFSAAPSRLRMGGTVALAALLMAANFVNPLYPFPFENNMAFVAFARLNQRAANFVERAYPNVAAVTTTFPLAGGLRRPAFGYVTHPLKVREIPNFEVPAIRAMAGDPPEVLVLYSVAWDPLNLLKNSSIVEFLRRFYGYEPQADRNEVEQLLGMRLVARWTERGQWIEVFHSTAP